MLKSLISRLLSNEMVLYVFSKYFYQFFSLISIVILSRLLSKPDFTNFSLIQLVSVFAPFASLGTIPVLAKKAVSYNEHKKYKFLARFLESVVLINGYSILIYSAIEALILGVIFDFFTWEYALIVLLANSVRAFYTLLHHYFRAINSNRILVYLNCITMLLPVVLLGVAWLMSLHDPISLELLYFGSSFFALCVFFYLSKIRVTKLTLPFDFKLFKYSSGFLVNNISRLLARNSDRWFVSIFFYSELGVYSLAFSLANGVLLFIEALQSFMYRTFVLNFDKGEMAKVKKNYVKGVSMAFGLTLVLSALLILVTDKILYPGDATLISLLTMFIIARIVNISGFNINNIILSNNLQKTTSHFLIFLPLASFLGYFIAIRLGFDFYSLPLIKGGMLLVLSTILLYLIEAKDKIGLITAYTYFTFAGCIVGTLIFYLI